VENGEVSGEKAGNVMNKIGNVLINATLRRVRVTTVTVQKQQALHILSVGL
jgi:hypothetical protein